MNEEIKEHIANALKSGIRLDGRKGDEFRKIEIQTDVIKTAAGSAHVKCGDTEVIAGVSLSVSTPFPDKPDDGVLMVGTELLPLSNPEFESGPPSIDSIEISRVIDRGVRESKGVDTSALCIKKGEEVWIISVDICPINTDGNLIDVGAIATVAAIQSACFPELKDGKVNHKIKTKKKLPVKELPLTITVGKIGDNFVVDPTEAEEEAFDCRLSVAILPNDKICALQKGGDHPIKVADMKKMLEIAITKSKELRKIILEAEK